MTTPAVAVLLDRVGLDALRAESLESRDFFVNGRGLDVEVHPVLAGPRLVDTLEKKLGLLPAFVDE